jgi:hypothetical protein
MSGCPNCGFTFAWDGSRCGHCGCPDLPTQTEEHRDDLIERIILGKAARSNLPNYQTHLLQDLAPETQTAIRRIAGERIQGRPVLCSFDSTERWTLLTTREVIGFDEGRLRSMRIDDIRSVDSASQPPMEATLVEVRRWKVSWEYLRLKDRRGDQAVVWVPCGSEAYAIWNILLRFARSN